MVPPARPGNRPGKNLMGNFFPFVCVLCLGHQVLRYPDECRRVLTFDRTLDQALRLQPFGRSYELSLGNRLKNALALCQGHRQNGWTPATYRVGEAQKPGPSICSTNPGGWSQVEPVLNLKHDVVAVQETFVLRDKVSSAKFTADKLGYYSSFTPARKTEGRHSGGLALLC
eukprot:2629381-Amphidinium_carterae.1